VLDKTHPERAVINRVRALALLIQIAGGERVEVTTGPINDWCLDLGEQPGVWIITDVAWCVSLLVLWWERAVVCLY